MNSDNDTSPCINVCKLDPSQAFCIGCGRSVTDIANWLNLGRIERIEVKREARRRLAQFVKQELKS